MPASAATRPSTSCNSSRDRPLRGYPSALDARCDRTEALASVSGSFSGPPPLNRSVSMSAGASAVPPSAAAATNGDTAPAVALPECEVEEKANACTEEFLSSFYDGVSTLFVDMVVSKHVHSAVVDQYVALLKGKLILYRSTISKPIL